MSIPINLSPNRNAIDALSNHIAIDGNNNWNIDGEAAVKELAQLAQSYTFMHNEASNYYRKLGILLAGCKIVVDTATSSTTVAYFGSFFTNGPGDTKIEVSPAIMGITALVCIIGIILTSVQIFISPKDSQIMHRQASIQFSRIVRDITNQLLLKAPRRKEMSHFFEQITAEYSRVQSQNDITIPDGIIVAYGEKLKELAAKGVKISFPDNVALRCGIIDLQYGQKHLENQLLPQDNEKKQSIQLMPTIIETKEEAVDKSTSRVSTESIKDRHLDNLQVPTEYKNDQSTVEVDSLNNDKESTKEIVLGIFSENDDRNKNHRQIIDRMYKSLRKPITVNRRH